MWEPVGPLPAAVYWRRRCRPPRPPWPSLGLLAWSRRQRRPGPGNHHPRGQPRRSLRSPAHRPAPGVGPDTDVNAGGGDPAGATARLRRAAARRRPPATARRGAAAARRLAARGPCPPRRRSRCRPTGPVPCSDDMLGVAAEIDPAEHRVGQRPTLRLVVTNISEQPCVRDLDSARQEIVVWSPDGRPALVQQRLCQRLRGRPAHPGARASRSRSRWPGPGAPRRPAAAAPAPSCRPATTGCMSRVDDVIERRRPTSGGCPDRGPKSR